MTLTAEEGEITSICSEYVTQHSPYYYQVQDHRYPWLKNSSVFFSESVRTVTIPLATVLLIHCLLCPISKMPNFQEPAEFNSNSGSFLEFLEYRMNHIWKKTGHDQFWFLSSQIFSLKKINPHRQSKMAFGIVVCGITMDGSISYHQSTLIQMSTSKTKHMMT